MNKILEILIELSSGHYIRVREGKHEYIGRFNKEEQAMYMSGMYSRMFYTFLLTGGHNAMIKEGDTLYNITDISIVNVKPLIYL